MTTAPGRRPAAEPHQHEQHQGRRAPRECPVCSATLKITQLGCDACGTGITGDFEQCAFCALDAADLDVLTVFLSSRGNVKDLARHLGVSYPTARSRYDDMVRRLGLSVAPATEATESSEPSEPDPDPADDRLAALRALATGQLDVEQARRRISGNG